MKLRKEHDRRYYLKNRDRLLSQMRARKRRRYAQDAEHRARELERFRRYRAKNRLRIKVRRESSRYAAMIKVNPSLAKRNIAFLAALHHQSGASSPGSGESVSS